LASHSLFATGKRALWMMATAPFDSVAIEKMLPVSVGLQSYSVNIYLLSYIRHIRYHFFLDGNGGFVMKS